MDGQAKVISFEPTCLPMEMTIEAAREPLIVRALRGDVVERTPVWLMRQAGRYLPEYRAIRAEHSFMETCRTPELAAEVTLQPIRRFGVDAAIIFSDILLVIDAMGAEVTFSDRGPAVGRPIRTAGDVRKLGRVEPERDLPYVAEAIRATVASLPEGVPLIGFAGAPFTLLTYLMEGKGERAVSAARAFLMREPDLADELLGLLADAVTVHLVAQVEAGARVVQLFDSWAGSLQPGLWERFAARYSRRVFEGLRHLSVPTIYFVRCAADHLLHLTEAGADAYSVGWLCDLSWARSVLGEGIPIQGNLDPAVLLTRPELIRDEVDRVIAAGGCRGHIFNLGHGVLPQTDPEMVRVLVEAVRESSSRIC
jgi:uroporphyrinogen decarboxylase